jgi:hypothetical protein
MDELRVSVEEGGGDPGLVTDWVFRRDAGGRVRIIENWPTTDEIYGDGHGISLPPKVVVKFAEWLASLPPSIEAPEPRI